MWSLEHFRTLFVVALIRLVEPSSSYFLRVGNAQDENRCTVQSLSPHKVAVSWSINVGELTPDAYAGVCFGKVHHGKLLTTLCWNKTSKAFAFSDDSESSFSSRKGDHPRNPQARESPDGSVHVSVEISSTRNVGHTVYWDVLWAEKMHNRVIDEMLHCTYTVENSVCGIKAHETRWGTKTRPGSWRWQVSLRHRYKGHSCGASVIGPQWILTAANCFDGQDYKDFTIVTGEQHLFTRDGFEQEVSIGRLFKHPRYNLSSIRDYDIALLKLNKTLQFNDRVTQVCLPQKDLDRGTKCFVTGWETTGNNKKRRFKVLKQTKLPLVSRIACKRNYKDWQSLNYHVTKRMRCAGYPKWGVSACPGDTGGPLVCENNQRWYQLGVASWGAGCRQEGYGVYTDVLKLKKWIRRTMRDL